MAHPCPHPYHIITSSPRWQLPLRRTKAGARKLLRTWQLNEQHSLFFYKANLQSSRDNIQSNEGKCLDRQTQTTVTQAGAEHLGVTRRSKGGGFLEQKVIAGQSCKDAMNVEERRGEKQSVLCKVQAFWLRKI